MTALEAWALRTWTDSRFINEPSDWQWHRLSWRARRVAWCAAYRTMTGVAALLGKRWV